VATALFAALLFVPTGYQAVRRAQLTPVMPPSWHEAMLWLRENTPEPFGDPQFYFARFPAPPVGEAFAYPESAFSVLSWWDYGYWIERIGRRIPTTNPTQYAADEVAKFLLAERLEDTAPMLARGRVRYVVVDSSMAVADYASKLPAIAVWAGRPASDFFQTCLVRQPNGSFAELTVFYPAYYTSMVVRLWTFGGHAFAPAASTWLIKVEDRSSPAGVYCEITAMGRFATYDDAMRARDQFPGARIAGLSMALSPVPLEELRDFHLLYDSKEYAMIPGSEAAAPALRIFEYSGWQPSSTNHEGTKENPKQ
jgi:hypothetical protein